MLSDTLQRDFDLNSMTVLSLLMSDVAFILLVSTNIPRGLPYHGYSEGRNSFNIFQVSNSANEKGANYFEYKYILLASPLYF